MEALVLAALPTVERVFFGDRLRIVPQLGLSCFSEVKDCMYALPKPFRLHMSGLSH